MRTRAARPSLHAWITAVLAFAVLLSGCAPFIEVTTEEIPAFPPSAETSTVLAADGTVLAQLHGPEDRDVVSLAEVSPVLQDAIVAVEDARFWDHPGVDIRALGRALVANTREGQVVEGGSTITQQLAKLLIVGGEVSLDRKLQEAAVAVRLETTLGKEAILERYLNTVYFGNGAYGVQAAARRYLGVNANEVGASGAALLAGLIRAPSRYDPFAAGDAALRRRKVVLGVLVREGVIDDGEAAAIRAAPLQLAPPRPNRFHAPYFVAHVLKILQHDPMFAVLGDTPRDRAAKIYGGGLRIETTLDPEWQAAAEEAVRGVLTEVDDPRAGLVAIEPSSGAIRALIGGRDYDDPADPVARFNLATDGRRQPGSAFKPVTLAAAIEAGRTLDDTLPGGASATLTVAGEEWAVHNYGQRGFGRISLREATVHSVNVAYAHLVLQVGPERVAALARALGIGRPLPAYPSLALGAYEVSVLELATVQATFAAGGVARSPVSVARIVAPSGTVLFEQPESEGERVLGEHSAALVTSALSDVVARGTGVRAQMGRPVAGKTGTSQDWGDAWFAGYTPDLAAAVWIGFPDAVVPMVPPRTRLRVEGGNWPAEIFARFASRALARVPANAFPAAPGDLVELALDPIRGCIPTAFTPRAVIEERAVRRGTEPKRPCPDRAVPVDIPAVSGMPIDQALEHLESAGLYAVQAEEFSPSYPPGYVIRQEPPPGHQPSPARGFEVLLWVSTADRTMVEVPDVLGMAAVDAQRILEDVGFVVVVTEGCPDGGASCPGMRLRPNGVWEQRPDAGARVPLHSRIDLSAYPRP